MRSRDCFVTRLHLQEAGDAESVVGSEADSDAEDEEQGPVLEEEDDDADVKEDDDAAKVSPPPSLQEFIHIHIIYFPPDESCTRSSVCFHTPCSLSCLYH